ncbi:MAG: hypothetical protein NC092_08115 [Butyrivibrio sp.]|nr:hypothetical protein [Muribaculum sp.]MCM1552640.1 hypothetical protein [Butyrivibrio sp.]
MTNTAELMEQGIACLIEKLGVLDTEYFISILKRDDFDYTVWQREYYDRMGTDEFMEKASAYADSHPYKGNAKIIL